MERSHADCSRNILGHNNGRATLRLDRYINLKCDFSSERYNHSNDLSKSAAIHMERSHADCGRNLFRYPDKCSRVRLDRYTHTKGKCCVERYNHSNDLSKSITIQLERPHADCSWNILGH